ncbi:MAG: hypothetical protein Q9165_007486 [Trypethelium subeluteriae]
MASQSQYKFSLDGLEADELDLANEACENLLRITERMKNTSEPAISAGAKRLKKQERQVKENLEELKEMVVRWRERPTSTATDLAMDRFELDPSVLTIHMRRNTYTMARLIDEIRNAEGQDSQTQLVDALKREAMDFSKQVDLAMKADDTTYETSSKAWLPKKKAVDEQETKEVKQQLVDTVQDPPDLEAIEQRQAQEVETDIEHLFDLGFSLEVAESSLFVEEPEVEEEEVDEEATEEGTADDEAMEDEGDEI